MHITDNVVIVIIELKELSKFTLLSYAIPKIDTPLLIFLPEISYLLKKFHVILLKKRSKY